MSSFDDIRSFIFLARFILIRVTVVSWSLSQLIMLDYI